MDQYVFSAGDLFVKPAGNSPTPVHLGALQGVTLSVSFAERDAYGRNVFPIRALRGAGRLTGVARSAALSARIFNDILLGNSTGPSAGATRVQQDEAQTIASGNVTATHAAAFLADLGVVKASNGAHYERVLSGPVARQYACNESSGLYTFNTSQNNTPVLLSYTWSDAANGSQVAIANRQQGLAPTFSVVLTATFQGQQTTLTLNACTSTKLTLPMQHEDFTISELDFAAMQDANGIIGSFNFEGDQAGNPAYPYVTLLLHGNGADGGQVFTDNSKFARTGVVTGTIICTGNDPAAFGNSAIHTGASVAAISFVQFTAAGAADLFLGAGEDGTIQFFQTINSQVGAGDGYAFPRGLFLQLDDGVDDIGLSANGLINSGTTLAFTNHAAFSVLASTVGLGNASDRAFVMMCRQSGVWYTFINGRYSGITGNYAGRISRVQVGNVFNNRAPNAFLEEVIVFRGLVRCPYTTGGAGTVYPLSAPPSAPFPNS